MQGIERRHGHANETKNTCHSPWKTELMKRVESFWFVRSIHFSLDKVSARKLLGRTKGSGIRQRAVKNAGWFWCPPQTHLERKYARGWSLTIKLGRRCRWIVEEMFVDVRERWTPLGHRGDTHDSPSRNIKLCTASYTKSLDSLCPDSMDFHTNNRLALSEHSNWTVKYNIYESHSQITIFLCAKNSFSLYINI